MSRAPVRRHERRTPSGGTTQVRRHTRAVKWSPQQTDEITRAASAFAFTFTVMLVWLLTAVMSLVAALASVAAATALSVLGYQVHKRRRARTHRKTAPLLDAAGAARKVRRTKAKLKRRYQTARHPLVTFRRWGVRRIKASLGYADKVVAGRNDPRRTK